MNGNSNNNDLTITMTPGSSPIGWLLLIPMMILALPIIIITDLMGDDN